MKAEHSSLLTILILSALVLSSCNQNTVYQKSILIDGAWTYSDHLAYEFTVEDTSSLYSLWLDVDHLSTYAFQNVYVQIHTSFPDGSSKSDIVSLELANQNGLWNGNCRGESCHINIPLQEKTYFQVPGKYGIRLEQFMRQDNLAGIKAFNLRLMKEAS